MLEHTHGFDLRIVIFTKRGEHQDRSISGERTDAFSELDFRFELRSSRLSQTILEGQLGLKGDPMGRESYSAFM